METIINFNDKKRLKTLLIGAAITVACLAFLYFIIFVDDKLSITYLAFFCLLFLAGVYLLFMGIKEILEKDKTALIINDTGIISRETPNARKVGLVPWADVERLAITTLYNQHFISLIAKDKSKYLSVLSGVAAKQLNEQGVIINVTAGEIDMSFDDLYKLVESYFNNHQNSGRSKLSL